MLNIPVRRKKKSLVTAAVLTTMLNGLQLPDDCLLNTVPALPPLSSVLLSLCVLSICIIPQHNSTLFSCYRVALRLGGNRRSAVRHILCRVSFIELLIYAVSKHSSCQLHQCKLFYHPRSSQMHMTHKCISAEGSECKYM